MGSKSSRRLQERRDFQDIAVARAKWELRFYCWRSTILLTLASAETIDAIVALIERRPPLAVSAVLSAVKQLSSYRS
jgi:hypothetical protein